MGAERKSFLTLGLLLALVLVPLAANTALVVGLHSLSTGGSSPSQRPGWPAARRPR